MSVFVVVEILGHELGGPGMWVSQTVAVLTCMETTL